MIVLREQRRASKRSKEQEEFISAFQPRNGNLGGSHAGNLLMKAFYRTPPASYGGSSGDSDGRDEDYYHKHPPLTVPVDRVRCISRQDPAHAPSPLSTESLDYGIATSTTSEHRPTPRPLPHPSRLSASTLTSTMTPVPHIHLSYATSDGATLSSTSSHHASQASSDPSSGSQGVFAFSSSARGSPHCDWPFEFSMSHVGRGINDSNNGSSGGASRNRDWNQSSQIDAKPMIADPRHTHPLRGDDVNQFAGQSGRMEQLMAGGDSYRSPYTVEEAGVGGRLRAASTAHLRATASAPHFINSQPQYYQPSPDLVPSLHRPQQHDFSSTGYYQPNLVDALPPDVHYSVPYSDLSTRPLSFDEARPHAQKDSFHHLGVEMYTPSSSLHLLHSIPFSALVDTIDPQQTYEPESIDAFGLPQY